MSAARALLEALAARAATEIPVAMVVAHPDDETIGAGASLALFRRLLLVHVTDGAPRDLRDASAAGFASARAYSEARFRELEAALRTGGVQAQRARLEAPDQQAAFGMVPLAGALTEQFKAFRPECVLTHAYEGGHPDHDSTCLVVRLAAARLDPPPAILETAGYFGSVNGELIVGGFLGEPAALVAGLDAAEQARREAMIDCFATQRATLAPFRGMESESFRLSPPYDFRASPNPGPLWYERFDWGISGPRWRELAGEALRAWGV